jgi:hypothetical protein
LVVRKRFGEALTFESPRSGWITRSCTTKFVYAFKREPCGGAVTLTVRSSSIDSFDVLLPFRCGSPPALGGSLGSVALSIPLGLMFGLPDPSLSRAISSRCAATVRRSSATSSNSFSTKLFKSPAEKSSRSAGDIPRMNLTRPVLGIVKSYRTHEFCPSYDLPDQPVEPQHD